MPDKPQQVLQESSSTTVLGSLDAEIEESTLVSDDEPEPDCFILTWNPLKFDWDEDGNYGDIVAATALGERVPGNWSVGSRRSGIAPGDVAFLFRQGFDRGVIGIAVFTSEIYTEDHWNGEGRPAAYADLEWILVVEAEQRIPVELLLEELPGVAWNNMQGSGVKLSEEDGRTLWDLWDFWNSESTTLLPDEQEMQDVFVEGSRVEVTVNRYERSPAAREACIDAWGTSCSVCDFSFGAVYGDIGEGFIHVHHVIDLSLLGDDYEVDPVNDLRPVCPNCHAMLHTARPALSVVALRDRIAQTHDQRQS